MAEAGAGEPVLLVHGWPQHWWCWRNVIPPLAAERRVICLDLRGFGWSDAPPGRYDKATFAADIVGLLDALGIERADLVAHDWGAWAGFLACLGHPDRFRSYLALNMYPPWPERRPWPWRRPRRATRSRPSGIACRTRNGSCSAPWRPGERR